jgi:hypothetical protein
VPETILVDFLWENYPGPLPEDAVTLTANDVPKSFAQHGRDHGKRRIHRVGEELPTALVGDGKTPHYQRLIAYAQNKEVPA